MIRERKLRARILFIVIFFASFFYCSSSFAYYEVDLTSYVTDVIDGDSFYITGDEVRLADVSCPEWYENGGPEATEALTNLIEGCTVYLDTDQLTGRDPYGRLVAVVYVEYNETHLANVNYLMWILGYADLTDYSNNEFNPYTWTTFETIESVDTEPETPDTSDAYAELLLAYTELYYNNENLINEYNELLIDYYELLSDFSVLEINHNELEEQFSELESRYNELEARLIELENETADSLGIPGFPIIALLIGIVYHILRKTKY